MILCIPRITKSISFCLAYIICVDSLISDNSEADRGEVTNPSDVTIGWG